jgi:hypothetical protein
MDNEIVYSTSELENSVDYLEMTLHFLKEKEHPHRFKWLMINLHGALYGFGVLAIKGTSSISRVYEEISEKKKQNAKNAIIQQYKSLGIEGLLDDGSNLDSLITFQKGLLLRIWDVIKRAESPDYMIQNTNSKLLELNDKQSHAIDKMIKYRNDFAHFKPMALGIIGDYEEDVVYPVLEVIEFIALETNNVLYFEDNHQKVEQIFKEIDELRNQ